jgi:hypothetical protein
MKVTRAGTPGMQSSVDYEGPANSGRDPPGLATQAVRESRKRREFVHMRLHEIMGRLLEMSSERDRITAELAGKANDKGPAMKALRDRRAYLAARFDILRKEQKGLIAERASIAAAAAQGTAMARKGAAADGAA